METICALSTAPLKSGIAVIRISGEDVSRVLDSIFSPFDNKPLSNRVMTYGRLVNYNGEAIDQILCVYFAGPNSFTGENVAELHCHGSLAVVASALSTLYAHGVRQALPGEFTKRAFLNGRLDLTQAEAIGELIAAENEQAAINAAAQLDGVLSREISGMYSRLVDVLAHFQAVIDYPDEDIDDVKATDITISLRCEADRLYNILKMTERGRHIKSGIRCAIIGKPNVGKSSLLNSLAGYDKAIVTPFAGTTRDIVEADISLGGLMLKLQDTAGLRVSSDEIEQIGIRLTKSAAENAAIILWVIDGNDTITEDGLSIPDTSQPKPIIAVINKADLPQKVDVSAISDKVSATVRLSAKDNTGFEELETAIKNILKTEDIPFDGTVITNARQEGLCRHALSMLNNAVASTELSNPPDMAMYDVEQALESLSSILGRNVSEDIVEKIFENYCVGK
jgi:tRNA modification GTPase